MKFTTAILLALPAMALAKPVETSVPDATADLSVCEEQAGSYSRYCARCEPLCASRTDPEIYKQCLYSVFMTVNYNDSQCWQHGGNDCANKAVDAVCGTQ